MRSARDFDSLAVRLAENLDDLITSAPRPRARRVEMIRRQIRHGLSLAFRAGVARGSERAADGVEDR
jgi:hypothetical protein